MYAGDRTLSILFKVCSPGSFIYTNIIDIGLVILRAPKNLYCKCNRSFFLTAPTRNSVLDGDS
jgi:hypothetical protein